MCAGRKTTHDRPVGFSGNAPRGLPGGGSAAQRPPRCAGVADLPRTRSQRTACGSNRGRRPCEVRVLARPAKVAGDAEISAAPVAALAPAGSGKTPWQRCCFSPRGRAPVWHIRRRSRDKVWPLRGPRAARRLFAARRQPVADILRRSNCRALRALPCQMGQSGYCVWTA